MDISKLKTPAQTRRAKALTVRGSSPEISFSATPWRLK